MKRSTIIFPLPFFKSRLVRAFLLALILVMATGSFSQRTVQAADGARDFPIADTCVNPDDPSLCDNLVPNNLVLNDSVLTAGSDLWSFNDGGDELLASSASTACAAGVKSNDSSLQIAEGESCQLPCTAIATIHTGPSHIIATYNVICPVEAHITAYGEFLKNGGYIDASKVGYFKAINCGYPQFRNLGANNARYNLTGQWKAKISHVTAIAMDRTRLPVEIYDSQVTCKATGGRDSHGNQYYACWQS